MSKRIVIIGGGAAGIGTALELANNGYQVDIYESNTLLSGSSEATPCRLGSGFHYPDEKTALYSLHTVINLVKNKPGYILGEDTVEGQTLRRCRYYLLKDSQFPADRIQKVWNRVNAEYKKLVNEDPNNAVFGPPEKFVRVLSPDEYQGDINANIVEYAVETGESFLNWPKLKIDLLEQIKQNANITVHEHTEVTDAKQNPGGEGFILTLKKDKVFQDIEAPFVINASWQNIEALDDKVGFYLAPERIPTNRTKVMIEIELPEAQEKIPSFVCAMGYFCSFTNLGKRRAFLTLEEVTNVEVRKGIFISDKSARYLAGEATLEEQEEFGKQILRGVVDRYCPQLEGAKFVRAKFGNVKTFGDFNKDDINSAHHQRCESGVVAKQIGWIDDASMKLVCFNENAQKVLKLVQGQHSASDTIETLSQVAMGLKDTFALNCDRIKNAFKRHLKGLYTDDPGELTGKETWGPEVFAAMYNKASLNNQFKARLKKAEPLIFSKSGRKPEKSSQQSIREIGNNVLNNRAPLPLARTIE